MRKLKEKQDKINIIVKNESLEDFFSRGRETAKLLDAKKAITPHRIISFEDVQDLAKFLK